MRQLHTSGPGCINAHAPALLDHDDEATAGPRGKPPASMDYHPPGPWTPDNGEGAE